MAYELIYTSLPSGLVASRSGFCTVARTASMPERLAALVEKLSVFDQLNGEEKYSYNKLSYANEVFFVLSSACASGNDYTGRTNFIVHHIVLKSSELTKYPSPADLILAYKDSFLKSYNKAPELIAEELDLSKLTFPARTPCVTWQSIFGDAGYASLLRSRSLEIYSKGNTQEQILTLFAESASLNVDKKSPWDFTFTTNLVEIESKTSYSWKVIRDCNTIIKKDFCIDLSTRTAPAFHESRLSEYARSAQMTKMESLDLNAGKPIKASNKFVVMQAPKRSINPMCFLYAFILILLFSVMLYLAFSILS